MNNLLQDLRYLLIVIRRQLENVFELVLATVLISAFVLVMIFIK